MTEYQRRQIEKAKARRKAWTGLFGFISLVVFGAFSWTVAPQVRSLIEAKAAYQFPAEWPVWAGNAVLAFVIFFVLFSIAMTLVAMLAGQPGDPRDVRTPTRRRRRR